MNHHTLLAAASLALGLSAASSLAADAYSLTVNSTTSTGSYNVNASAPFTGTMIGDTTATPPTRTKTGTFVLFPFPPHARCTPFTATQNDPLNISGSLTGTGNGSNIRPSGAFVLGVDIAAGTAQVQNLSLNLLGTSTAAVSAGLSNFRYPNFCTVDPACSVPFLIPISLTMGTLNITALTVVQTPGVAAGLLTVNPAGGYDFTIPVVLTVTAAANFSGSAFPIDPQDVPMAFTGTVVINGNTASVTNTLTLSLAPPSPTTPTPLPPTPFTTPAGSAICAGLNLTLELTITSTTINVSSTANLLASGPKVVCPCDWNHNGVVSVQDVFDFLAGFFAGAGDFNGLGGTTVQDVFDFLACYFSLPLPC